VAVNIGVIVERRRKKILPSQLKQILKDALWEVYMGEPKGQCLEAFEHALEVNVLTESLTEEDVTSIRQEFENRKNGTE
jgi:hypothetical protein